MEKFNFYQPIQVRYNDIDAQGHVNNAKYVTYIEFARFRYIIEAGLWGGSSFLELGLIVADVHVSYLAPIFLGQTIRVGVKITNIGIKSLTFIYQVEDVDSGKIMAKAETMMVAFDYRTKSSIPVPDKWKKLISDFEGTSFK